MMDRATIDKSPVGIDEQKDSGLIEQGRKTATIS